MEGLKTDMHRAPGVETSQWWGWGHHRWPAGLCPAASSAAREAKSHREILGGLAVVAHI